MKKLLLLAVLGISSAYAVDTNVADKLISFTKLVQNQKQEWANFAKDSMTSKMDLMQKHHDAMFAEKLKDLEALKAGGNVEDLMQKCLEQHQELYEQCAQEWKKWFEEHNAKAEALQEKHAKEYAAFKGTGIKQAK